MIDIIHSFLNNPNNHADRFYLGHGIQFVPIERENNRNEYGHLYKNASKVSDIVFRIGGLASKFRKGENYMLLLKYPNISEDLENERESYPCIIDNNGKIVFESNEQFFSELYFKSGVIVTMKGVLYNLLTGDKIIESKDIIETENYFIAKDTSWERKEDTAYKIKKLDGTFEIIK